AEAPQGNSGPGVDPLAPGTSVVLKLTADGAGLKPAEYNDAVKITSNGGVVSLPIKLSVTSPNLNGRWVGAFYRAASLLPAPALTVRQSGTMLQASIDGRLSPAFASSIRRQAGEIVFEQGESGAAAGVLEVTDVKDLVAVEMLTVTANDERSFRVTGASSGE